MIQPSGVEAVHRGTTAWVPLDPAVWDETLAGGLARLAEPLREAVARAGLAGRRVEVHYESPDAVVEMLTLPLPRVQARAAGALRIREALGGGDACVCIGEVPTPRRVGAESTTMVMAADRHATVEAFAAAVRAAGAHPEALIPLRATVLRDAIASTLSTPAARANAVVWIDRHSTAIAGGSHGLCRFARSLSAGCDLLVEAYRRAAREVGGCDYARASDLLFAAGIPRRDQIVDEPLGLRGDRVIPLAQPALQRLAIEVKQTLRFGLPEGEASRAVVTLAGPAARIPGLAETLGVLIENSAQTAEHAADHARRRLAAGILLGFTPAAVRERRARRGLYAAVAMGAAAACLAVALDAAWTRGEIARLHATIARNEEALRTAKADAAVDATLAATSEQLAKLDALTDATVGAQASWAAAMKFISTLPTPGLELQELSGAITPDGPTLTLRGILPGPGSHGGTVATLLETLGASPLAARVQVGSTRTLETDSGPRIQFSIAMTLRTLSRTALSAAEPAREAAR